MVARIFLGVTSWWLVPSCASLVVAIVPSCASGLDSSKTMFSAVSLIHAAVLNVSCDIYWARAMNAAGD